MITNLSNDELKTFNQKMQQEGIEFLTEEHTKESVDQDVPIPQKVLLTVDEAAKYTGIGQAKLRAISNEDHCPFVLWNGKKRMFKREKLVSYLITEFSI